MGIPQRAHPMSELSWVMHLRTPLWVMHLPTQDIAFVNHAAMRLFGGDKAALRQVLPQMDPELTLDGPPATFPVFVGGRRFIAHTTDVDARGEQLLVELVADEGLQAPSGIPVVRSIRRLLSSFAEPLAIADDHGMLVWCNSTFTQLVTDTTGAGIGQHVRDIFVHPDDVRKRDDIDDALKCMTPYRSRARVDEEHVLRVSVAPSSGEAQRNRFFVVAVRDISRQVRAEAERERAQQELARSEARFARLAQNVPGVLFELTYHPLQQYRFTWVATTSHEVLGVPPEAMTDSVHALLELIHPDDLSDFKRSLEHSRRNQADFTWQGRILSHTPTTGVASDDNDIRFVHLKGRPGPGDVDGAVRWDGIIMDVTEQKQLQLLVESSERMASVGGLAAGVAHEINNPLAYILSNLQVVLEELTNNHGVVSSSGVRALEEARTGAHRVREIVRDLKQLSRPEKTEVGPVQLNRVIESTISMAMTEIRHRARLIKDIPDNLPDALANEGRIGQVLLNLLVNAAQAIDEGHVNDNHIRVSVGRADNDFLFIEIEDTGRGIPQAILKRVFDPFFTTKKVGVGTGLGLSICHNIVREHGGQIHISSDVGRGTCFRVLLPIAPHDVFTFDFADDDLEPLAEVMPPPPNSPQPAKEAKAKAKVLLIDDEPALVRALRRQLKGYDVTTAAGGTEALEHLQACKDFDVVLCDLMMPDCTGMDLYEQVDGACPQLREKFIFMTGGVFTERAREFLSTVQAPVLEKPFDAQVVRRTVQRILGQHAKSA